MIAWHDEQCRVVIDIERRKRRQRDRGRRVAGGGFEDQR
jgi:hypothetical protein